MKKWIFLLGASLMLTGCSNTTVVGTQANVALASDMNLGYTSGKELYINDDMKKTIEDINELTDKYVKGTDEWEYDSLYIDVESNIRRIKDITFTNSNTYEERYFIELVQILERDLAEGLEDYVQRMKSKKLDIDETIVEKIGKTLVYVQNRGGDEDNYISIRIDFLDVEDEYYREVFNNISNEKYILDNLVIGDKLNLIDLINPNNSHYLYDYNEVNIRYNIFFQDKDIEKVNILIQRKEKFEFKDYDMDVFINLLNSLELNELEKDLLVGEYKSLVEGKLGNKKIDLENYKLMINANKGNSYSGKDIKLIYFSIERH